MSPEGPQVASRGDVPHLDELIVADRRDGLPIGSDRQGADPAVMPRQGGTLRAASNVPDPDHLVRAAGDQGLAVASKHQSADGSHVSLERPDFTRSATSQIRINSSAPCRGESLAVGREGHGEKPTLDFPSGQLFPSPVDVFQS